MPSIPAHGPAADPWLGLGLTAALVVLSVALLALWRHDALRQAHDPARHAWFRFVVRMQWFAPFASVVLPATVWMANPYRAIGALAPSLVAHLDAVACALIVLPLLVVALATVVVTSDVQRRVRGEGPALGERLGHTAAGFIVLILPLTGLVTAFSALREGHLRAAILWAFGGVLSALWLASTRSSTLGLRPEAATAGPLRDRLFELAARARVNVRQVYVLSAARLRLANAFAVRGGNVLLTDHLLEQLSRREVDGIIAHELAHLRQGHPTKRTLATVVPMALAFAAVSVAVPTRAWGQAAPLALLVGGVLGMVSMRGWSRRYEYAADRGAVEITGDAAGLITALVRLAQLNAMPIDWSRAQEAWLTHPSVRRRARALAAAGYLSEAEAEALLFAPPDASDRWPRATPVDEPVFGTAVKHAHAARSMWSVLLAGAFVPALVLALLQVAQVRSPWPLTTALAALAGFAAALAALDLVATRDYPAWVRALAERQGRAGEEQRYVALAPCAGGMIYEGFADWDLGRLELDPVTLRFEGERTRFALERDAIVGVDLVAGLPGWVPAPRVALRWRAADGTEHVFTVRDARSRSLRAIARDSLRLLGELRAWHGEPAPAGVRALAIGEPPRTDAVTGTPYADTVAPRAAVPLVVVAAGLALLMAMLLGLPLAPGRGPWTLEAMAAAVLALLALRAPMWRAAGAARAAAAGSRRRPPRATPAGGGPGRIREPGRESRGSACCAKLDATEPAPVPSHRPTGPGALITTASRTPQPPSGSGSGGRTFFGGVARQP